MKKCLFITQVFPSGLSGTTVKTRETINVLLDNGYKVDVCCIQPDKLLTNSFKHKNLSFHIVSKKSVISKFTLSYILRVFFVLLSLLPFRVKKMYDKKLDDIIRKLRSENQYEWVFFDGFATLQYAHEHSDRNVYIDDEDITQLVLKRSRTEPNFLLKAFFLVEYVRCSLYEKSYLKRVEKIWAINSETAKRLSTLSDAEIAVMPTIAKVQKNIFSKKSRDIVFTGLLSWLENVNGIIWFLQNCWEDIHKEFPDTQLNIVGQLPDKKILDEVKKHKNVNLLGFVEDLEDVYKHSALAISPIFINVGIKVKTVTYLSYGLPIVSTKIATLGLSQAKGILMADTPKSFVAAVREILEDAPKRVKLSKDSYDNFMKNHSAKRLEVFLRKYKIISSKQT